MRICSLVPGATEVVAALGQADRLVGISHECDFPPSIRHAPVVIEPLVDSDHISSAAIDQQVRTLVSSGQHLYRLNEKVFAESRPDVILTQDLCHVCAITPDQLIRAVRSLPSPPELLTLNPTSLEDILADIERIGKAIRLPSEGRDFVKSLRKRLATVQQRSQKLPVHPRVLCLEWLSPLYIGGHWIPEMVDLAGGQDVLGHVRQPSQEVTWEQVTAVRPDIVILMPCGFSVERTMKEMASLCQIPSEWSSVIVSWPKAFIVDAASYFSRPGPRLVDGVELLAALFSGTIPPRFDETVVRALSQSTFP